MRTHDRTISRSGQRLPAAWILSNTRTDRYLTEKQFDGSGLAPVLQGEARWISDSRIKLPSSRGAAASARSDYEKNMPRGPTPSLIGSTNGRPQRVDVLK